MIPDRSGKPESNKTDPDQLTRMLELELAQKRASWAAAHARSRKMRAFSLVLLAVVVLGGLLAFFFLFTRLNEERANAGTRPETSSSP